MKALWQPTFQTTDAQLQSDTLVHQGHYDCHILKYRHKLFRGGWTSWIEREQIKVKNSAAVVLYDPNLDQVLLIEQFRTGAMDDHGQASWLLEIVAGYVESGETPQQTAKREAKEEANCDIQTLYPVLTYYTTPGGLTEKTSVFCGMVKLEGVVPGVYGNPEETEDIKVHRFKAAEAFKLLEEGLLTSSSTVIGLQWLQMNRAYLQSVGYV